jgi:hypothetical protein
MASNNRVKKAKQGVTYVLARGVSRGGLKAEEIGEELSRIYAERGELKTKTVVDEARPEGAVLHPVFEWQDSIAGEKYREWQARDLIRSIQIVNKETKAPTHVYVNVPSPMAKDKAGTYEPISVVVNNPDKFVRALSAAQTRLDAAQRAIDDLRSAGTESDISADRMAALSIAAMALQTARDAVSSIH